MRYCAFKIVTCMFGVRHPVKLNAWGGSQGKALTVIISLCVGRYSVTVYASHAPHCISKGIGHSVGCVWRNGPATVVCAVEGVLNANTVALCPGSVGPCATPSADAHTPEEAQMNVFTSL